MKGIFLDIGCAKGDTLEAARDMGADVYGIDLNPKSVEICKAKGLNVYCGTLEDAVYPNNCFDTIWMSQVIEHLPPPATSLSKIRRILKLEGRLYIFCPNSGSYLSKLIGKYWHGWDIPFHFYAFTEKTIQRLAEETVFTVERISTVTPDHFFAVSLKSYLRGDKDGSKRPVERGRLFDSLIFRAAISPYLGY